MDKKVEDTSKNQNIVAREAEAKKRPNESGVFSVEAHVKIFDPNTSEIYVEKRA